MCWSQILSQSSINHVWLREINKSCHWQVCSLQCQVAFFSQRMTLWPFAETPYKWTVSHLKLFSKWEIDWISLAISAKIIIDLSAITSCLTHRYGQCLRILSILSLEHPELFGFMQHNMYYLEEKRAQRVPESIIIQSILEPIDQDNSIILLWLPVELHQKLELTYKGYISPNLCDFLGKGLEQVAAWGSEPIHTAGVKEVLQYETCTPCYEAPVTLCDLWDHFQELILIGG